MNGTKEYLNTLERLFIEAYENICNVSVTAKDNATYIINDDFVCSYADLFNVAFSDLNNHFENAFKAETTSGKTEEKTAPLSFDNIKIEYNNGNVYACKEIGSVHYEVGELEPESLDYYRIENNNTLGLVESKSREDMNTLEYELYKKLYEAMTAEVERVHKTYNEPITECFYTGGGYWCTVHQLSGNLSDYYYSFCNEDDDGTMALYSHRADLECNDDEFAFYGVVKYIDINNASVAERDIYNTMVKVEAETLKENGYPNNRTF